MKALLSDRTVTVKAFAKQAVHFLAERVGLHLSHGRPNAQTIARDVTHIRWLHRALFDGPMGCRLSLTLQLLQRGLRRDHAANARVTKALPITGEVLNRICRACPRPTALALKLAFLTASRLDDVFKLQRGALTKVNGSSILVMWGVTKTNTTAEKRADHQQVFHQATELMPLVDNPELLNLTSPDACLKALRTFPVPERYVQYWASRNPTTHLRRHFTGHSLKRGKAAVLWKQAADGVITVHEVMHRLKHKTLQASLAYAPIPLHASIAVQRSHAQA